VLAFGNEAVTNLAYSSMWEIVVYALGAVVLSATEQASLYHIAFGTGFIFEEILLLDAFLAGRTIGTCIASDDYIETPSAGS
jgi:hypothetical protein